MMGGRERQSKKAGKRTRGVRDSDDKGRRETNGGDTAKRSGEEEEEGHRAGRSAAAETTETTAMMAEAKPEAPQAPLHKSGLSTLLWKPLDSQLEWGCPLLEAPQIPASLLLAP